jgi:hypothetical protein
VVTGDRDPLCGSQSATGFRAIHVILVVEAAVASALELLWRRRHRMAVERRSAQAAGGAGRPLTPDLRPGHWATVADGGILAGAPAPRRGTAAGGDGAAGGEVSSRHPGCRRGWIGGILTGMSTTRCTETRNVLVVL